MDETPDLTVLANSYPDPGRGMRALVLKEFEKIATARRRGWTWPEVAAGLGLAGRGRSVATAFARVKRRITAGDLEPPKATHAPRPSPATKAAAREGISADAAKGVGPDSSDPEEFMKRFSISKKEPQ